MHGICIVLDSNFFHGVSKRCFPLPLSRVASYPRSFILLPFVESVDEAAARCDVLHASIEPILEKKETPSPEKHALSTRFMRARVSPRLQLSNIFFPLFSFPSLSLSLSSSLSLETKKKGKIGYRRKRS